MYYRLYIDVVSVPNPYPFCTEHLRDYRDDIRTMTRPIASIHHRLESKISGARSKYMCQVAQGAEREEVVKAEYVKAKSGYQMAYPTL